MSHLFHNSAVDLFDTSLPVDNYVVEFLGQNTDNVFEICVDFAIATGTFGATYGNKNVSVFFNHSVKNTETRLVEQLDRTLCIAVLDIFYNIFSDVVDSGFHFNAQSR